MVLRENEVTKEKSIQQLKCQVLDFDMGLIQQSAGGISEGGFLVTAQIRESCMCTTATKLIYFIDHRETVYGGFLDKVRLVFLFHVTEHVLTHSE